MKTKKGGLADSPFFKMQPVEQPQPSPPRASKNDTEDKHQTKQPAQTTSHRRKSQKTPATMTPRHRDTTIPSNHDTVIPRHHDTTIETVRTAVMKIGKEAATHRFTSDEKSAISDIIYAYKRQDIKTSENEITRIAINYLIADYEENGENSVLHQAIKALTT